MPYIIWEKKRTESHLMIHRTKLEKADEFYVKHKGSLLVPPREADLDAFPKLVRKEFALKEKSDIVFSGLGWIRVAKPAISDHCGLGT